MTWVYNASPELEAESIYPATVAVALVFTSLMFLVVCLRFHFRRSKFAADDWITILSLVKQYSSPVRVIPTDMLSSRYAPCSTAPSQSSKQGTA